MRAALALTLALTLAAALVAGSAGLAAGSSPSTLEGRIASAQAREGELHAGIGADSHQIAGFQGRIEDLRARLGALESSLEVERRLLASLKGQLHSARIRLVALRSQLARYRQVLVAQVIAAYEQPPPDIATVVLEAHGFADLLERLDSLRAISRANAAATQGVADAKRAVTLQEARLAALEASRARETRAVLVQRNEVVQLHLALVDRRLQFIRARDRKSAELASLHAHKHALEHQLSVLQAREFASGGVFPSGGARPSPAPQGALGLFGAAGAHPRLGGGAARAPRPTNTG